jgi:tetratricopeptide (TPR) repeat protein
VVARAEQLFHVGDYGAALVDFSRAYQLLAGYPRQYVVLHNLAVCYERLFRYDEALHFYERYLVEGGPSAEDRVAVGAALDTLRNLLATLRLEANVRGEVWVDDRQAGEIPATLRIPAGRHVVEVRAVLHESARRELTLEARSEYRLRLELAPLSNYRGLPRGYFIGSAVLTGVLLLTAGVLAANTLAARGRGLDDAARTMQLQTAMLERDQANVQRWALGTDLAFAGAALFGVTSVLLFFLTDWGEHEPASKSVAGLTRTDRIDAQAALR